jgi:uncharacterized protein (DUF608 family)
MKEEEEYFKALLVKATTAYEALWNGNFYSYDSSPHHHDIIMADQLVGQWFVPQHTP